MMELFITILLAAGGQGVVEPKAEPVGWQQQNDETCGEYHERIEANTYQLWFRHWCVKPFGRMCNQVKSAAGLKMHPYWRGAHRVRCHGATDPDTQIFSDD